MDPNDFDGCNRACRTKQEHTLEWGRCEHAVPPEPTVSMSAVYTDPSDGYPAIGFDTYTVQQLADLIEPSLTNSDAGWPIPFDVAAARTIALRVARAIVHRNDAPADTSEVQHG